MLIQELLPGGVHARRPDNSLDNVFFFFFLVLNLLYSLQRGSNGFNTEKTILFQRSRGGPSALDKLLGQLGIYATWLSSTVYLQQQLRIFIYFFTPRFFFCDYTFSYCMKPSGTCLHIYSLPPSSYLKYQTSGFYCT